MRRPPSLTLDTNAAISSTDYDLTQSPRSLTYSESIDLKHPDESPQAPAPAPQTPPQAPCPNPSIRILFSLLSSRQRLLLLAAVFCSVISGGIAPFMTYVVGRSFDTFAQYPLTDPTKADKEHLLRGVGMVALQLVGLAAAALALSSITSSLWIWTGEHNVMALRKRVYTAVTNKDMEWFDTKMGADGGFQPEGEQGPLGAGGLMAKFARETDDVRMASSLASGMVMQYLTTCIVCLVLAFRSSWSLTLVILSAVPVLMIIQAFSQKYAGPLLAAERGQLATAATLVDRAVAAIATVKAFNAAQHEHTRLAKAISQGRAATTRLSAIWGFTSGLCQFVMMTMFVQGFWFGARLVRTHAVSPGAVMAVFWACLIAVNNLQMCIPQFMILAKGKFAMATLLALLDDVPPDLPVLPNTPTTPRTPGTLRTLSRRPLNLRKIIPKHCAGEFALHDVSFAYPSRPNVPVLSNVSLFLPANETTFIVGGSGSGKSTVAALLLRLYAPTEGSVYLDDQDVTFLDGNWATTHVAGVAQDCVLFDASVHDNVAMGLAAPGSGRRPQDATRAEVIEACRAALMHEFVNDLPEGYDTRLGHGGANLSGGQRQRLAIARARLRNPTVLILDEATSALDATSRILVFEAIKRWRAHRTTIVITHDLSQIAPHDFVYVLQHGQVAEQGYRYDLEAAHGEFRAMMDAQGFAGIPPPPDDTPRAGSVEELLAELEAAVTEMDESPFNLKHQSLARPVLRPITLGNWMFQAVANLTRNTTVLPPPAVVTPQPPPEIETRPRRRSSIHIDSLPQTPLTAYTVITRRRSLQFTPSSPVYTARSISLVEDDDAIEDEKSALKRTASEATMRRRAKEMQTRKRWDDKRLAPLTTVKVEKHGTEESQANPEAQQQQSFWSLMRDVYPTVPKKHVVLLGIGLSLLSGAMTPVFSFLLSQLIVQVSIGATHKQAINMLGGIVLAITALDGLFMGLKYFVMETAAVRWVEHIRRVGFAQVLSQDKKWFDRGENAATRMVQILVKDGDDARNLISTVLCQLCVVTAMVGVGIVWALVRGWQLTLVGIAIAPVFAVTMAIQTNLVARCETQNKCAREDVAKGYYEAILNIRGIRSMGFESVFKSKFDSAADRALATGVRGSFIEGCTYGVASALIYLAEALLFYVGAVLIARGTYTYLQMVEVLNLVVFSVSIGSQLMAFTQKIAKSVQATRDFNQLLKLSTKTDESSGALCPNITGAVAFKNVSFSYPERPEAPILKNISMNLADGECVAVVGASGSGKSTVAALLQRLYEPDTGSISIGQNNLSTIDVHHLREHVAVVSQNPNLFDATITENIAYGDKALSDADVRRAARAAHVHDFVMSLPNGYDTLVGENASLISGGQAQRLQIARALARPAKILILDECTSALDPANQTAVMETIRHAKVGRTTVMVTHKLPVMRMCDRILVIHEGVVAEQGTYEDLMERKGVFFALANGGEWVCD